MYDANTHYVLMQRKQAKKRASPVTFGSDSRAAERIMPGLKERAQETRLDRILRPYRGRTEGPTEPEVT